METLSKEQLVANRKINRRILILYRSFATDLLFYYAISYLFMVQVKGLSASQILLTDAFYPIFKVLFQIPCTMFVQKYGKRNSIIWGNICIFLYLLLVLIMPNYFVLIIANIFCALGFSIKNMCESNILYDSLEKTKDRREIFSNMEGKSQSAYSIIDAITSLFCGYLFVINPYLPMLLSLAITCITIIMGMALRETNQISKEKNHTFKEEYKKYTSDLKDGFVLIGRSHRIISLLFFNSILVTTINVCVTLMKSLLEEMSLSSEYFGIIFGVLALIQSYFHTKANSIHNVLKNKLLTICSITYGLTLIISGLIVYYKIPNSLMYIIVLFSLAIHSIIKGVFYIVIHRYLSSFTTSNIRIKIYAAKSITENLLYGTTSFICSLLINRVLPSQVICILGTIIIFLIGSTYFYTKKHLGLKPEEYPKNDILNGEYDIESQC